MDNDSNETSIQSLQREIIELKSQLIMWMAGFHIASVGVIIALLTKM